MGEIIDKIKVVGTINERVVNLLGLSIEPGTPILIGPTNIEHMKKTHSEDFKKYFGELENILNSPDFVSKHPIDGSIQYIKVYDEHVLVGVRLSSTGKPFARTLFTMTENKLKKYREKNALKKYNE